MYERVEPKGCAKMQFLAIHTLCWDSELMGEPTDGFVAIDPGTTHDDLTQLREIAHRTREELARAKAGSTLWEALRFILSAPVETTDDDEGPAWESDYWGYTDYPEPDQTYGAADD